MATTVLLRRAKLLRPRAAEDLIPRRRLLDRLDAGLDRPLTLLSTPAGYGKTTLLGQWLDACPYPSAWLALDAHDNALPSFVTMLVGALRTLWPDAGRETLGLLQLPATPPPDYLGAALADELLDLPGPALLVLDDYHAVDNPEAHAVVAALLEYPPPGLRLALASRVEPPLPLPRLRARGLVTELRGRDLAFTPDEARAFLERTTGTLVAPAAATLLEQRTEGWAVGLRLAALALRDEGDSAAVTRAFTGRRQRHALDFLLDEVLARQPEDVQAFLLRTVVVERVCGPLADALTEPLPMPGAGEAMLRRLVDANLFVVALAEGDDGLEWARYHQLFRELLRERLERDAGPAMMADLHRRAADWLVGRGLIDEALDQLLAASDHDAAARLVERRTEWALDREDWPTLERWLGRLPEELVQRQPGLLLAHAFVDFFRGRRVSMAGRLAAATALLDLADPVATATLRAWADSLVAMLCWFRGDGAGAVEATRRALPALPGPDSYLGGNARYAIVVGLYLAGQHDEALRVLGDTTDAAARLAPRELLALVTILFQSGDLHAARRWTAILLEMSARRGLPLLVGWAHYILGRVAYDLDSPDEARAHFMAAAMERGRYNLVCVTESLLGVALAEQAAGRPGGAARLLAELDETLVETGNDEARPLVLACQAHTALQRGDRDAAIRWLESDPPDFGQSLIFMENSTLTQALALLARGAPGDAAAAGRLLAALRERAERERATGCLIRVLATQALAHEAQGDRVDVLGCLNTALDLAEPGGYVRTFLDLGEPLAALLRELAGRRSPTPFFARLLAACGTELLPTGAGAPVELAPVDRVPAVAASGGVDLAPPALPRTGPTEAVRDPGLVLVETLTEREVQVLAQLARHMTNKEIAAELSISPLTVKRHVSNLCGKLGAGTRRQAVAMATSMRLIPQQRPPW